MTYEQLDINTVSQRGERIYQKIDWYTAIFVDRSVGEVISWTGLDLSCCEDDFFANQVERASGLDDKIIFAYNGVNIEVKQSSYYGRSQDVSIFDLIVPKIRLDISGSGLDFLRSCGINVDVNLSDVAKLLDGQHLTRCDFAFDLIDYNERFIDELILYCQNNHTVNNRLVVTNKTAALVYDIHTGSQKTVYIGSPQSDKLLRVYDKRMQCCDPVLGWLPNKNPYGSPSSWIRIELQTRNKIAHSLAVGCGDFLPVFRWIYEQYNFADLSTPAHRREPAVFWRDLWDWETIPQIIQNLHNVPKRDSLTVCNEQADKILQSFMLCVTRLGWDAFFYKLNAYLWALQNPDKTSNPSKFLRCHRKLINRYNELDLSVLRSPDGITVGDDGLMRFTLSSKSLLAMDNIIDTIDDKGANL